MTKYDRALKIAQRTNPDMQKAFSLLEQARDDGDARAVYALATFYLHGKEGLVRKNLRRAISLLKEAMDGGNPDAMFDLAICYEQAIGVPVNQKRAFTHYLKAALVGDHQSVYEVGRCYWWGLGVSKDRNVAKIWLDHAEALGIKG